MLISHEFCYLEKNLYKNSVEKSAEIEKKRNKTFKELEKSCLILTTKKKEFQILSVLIVKRCGCWLYDITLISICYFCYKFKLLLKFGLCDKEKGNKSII